MCCKEPKPVTVKQIALALVTMFVLFVCAISISFAPDDEPLPEPVKTPGLEAKARVQYIV